MLSGSNIGSNTMPLSGDAKAKYQREYMRKRRAGQKQGSNSGLTGGASSAANASLKARVAELEDQIQRMTTRGVYTDSMLAKENEVKARVVELEAEVTRLKAEKLHHKPAEPSSTPEKRQPPPLPRTREELLEAGRRAAEARREARAASLSPEGKLATLEGKLKAAQARIAHLENSDGVAKELVSVRRQLAHARYRLREVTRADKGTVFVAKADLRNIRACLHPDRAQSPAQREQAEAASKAFNALPIKAV
jgi:hypothetical protein